MYGLAFLSIWFLDSHVCIAPSAGNYSLINEDRHFCLELIKHFFFPPINFKEMLYKG